MCPGRNQATDVPKPLANTFGTPQVIHVRPDLRSSLHRPKGNPFETPVSGTVAGGPKRLCITTDGAQSTESQQSCDPRYSFRWFGRRTGLVLLLDSF